MAEPQVPPPPRANTQRTINAPGRKVWYKNPWIIGGIAAGAALVYLWWRSRTSGSGGTTSSTTSSTQLNAADLSYLQGELNGLANGGGSGGGGYYGGGGYTATTTSGTGGTGGGRTASTTTGTGKTTASTTSKTGGGKPKSAPRAPSGLATSDVTETTARGTWAVTANASSYRAQLWRGGDILHDSTSSALYRAWSGLKGDTTYKWHVMAINSAGQSGWSGTKTFTTAKHSVHTPTPVKKSK